MICFCTSTFMSCACPGIRQLQMACNSCSLHTRKGSASNISTAERLFNNKEGNSHENGEGFVRDAWLQPKWIWNAKQGERNPWVHKPARAVICFLKYTWPVNLFLKARTPEKRSEVFPFKFMRREMLFKAHLKLTFFFNPCVKLAQDFPLLHSV